jgi:hypothetical protein
MRTTIANTRMLSLILMTMQVCESGLGQRFLISRDMPRRQASCPTCPTPHASCPLLILHDMLHVVPT